MDRHDYEKWGPYAHYVMRRYRRRYCRVSYDDLCAEADLALVLAFDTFDPGWGTDLSTYIYTCVKRNTIRYTTLNRGGTTTRTTTQFNKLRRFESKLRLMRSIKCRSHVGMHNPEPESACYYVESNIDHDAELQGIMQRTMLIDALRNADITSIQKVIVCTRYEYETMADMGRKLGKTTERIRQLYLLGVHAIGEYLLDKYNYQIANWDTIVAQRAKLRKSRK